MDEITYRLVTQDDAPMLLAHLKIMAPALNIEDDEITLTVEDERQIINNISESPNSFFLGAFAKDKLAGLMTVQSPKRKSVAHNASLGLSVNPEFQHQGIGRSLMEKSIKHAEKNTSLRRLEILSYETNTRARSFYLGVGFLLEGYKEGYVKTKDGYIGAFLMAYYLRPLPTDEKAKGTLPTF